MVELRTVRKCEGEFEMMLLHGVQFGFLVLCDYEQLTADICDWVRRRSRLRWHSAVTITDGLIFSCVLLSH